MPVGELKLLLSAFDDSEPIIFTIEDEYESFTISEFNQTTMTAFKGLELETTLPNGFAIVEL